MGFLISAIYNCALAGCIVLWLLLLLFSYLNLYHEYLLISALLVSTAVALTLSVSVIKDQFCSYHRGNRA